MTTAGIGPTEPAVTLVTGAGSGIGAAVARRAAAAGQAVVICGRRAESLARVAGSAPGIQAMVADVTIPDEVDRLMARIIDRHGRLDHVVANAGIMRSGTVLDTTPQQWDEVIRGNLSSAFLVARAALPHLQASRGSLVGVASIAALRASAGAAAYATSKAALAMLIHSIAVDFGPAGVRANVVCPGWVRTEMADEEMREFGAAAGLGPDAAYDAVTRLVPQRRPADPDEVAAAVLWLLGPESSYVNGATLTVDGGTTLVDAGTVGFDFDVTPRPT